MTARSTPYAMDMGNRDYRCYAKESVQYVRCVAVNGLTIMVITSGRDDGMKHVLHSHQIDQRFERKTTVPSGRVDY